MFASIRLRINKPREKIPGKCDSEMFMWTFQVARRAGPPTHYYYVDEYRGFEMSVILAKSQPLLLQPATLPVYYVSDLFREVASRMSKLDVAPMGEWDTHLFTQLSIVGVALEKPLKSTIRVDRK